MKKIINGIEGIAAMTNEKTIFTTSEGTEFSVIMAPPRSGAGDSIVIPTLLSLQENQESETDDQNI